MNSAHAWSAPRGLATASRPWGWLAALADRLHVDLQLVDASYAPISLAPVPAPNDLLDLLRTGVPSLRTAIAAALRGGSPPEVSIDDRHIACCALGEGENGVLIVSRTAPPGTQPRRELSLIANWLAAGIAAHVQSPFVGDDETLSRVSSMLGILIAAGAHSDRALLTDFADTLAIWHDIEVRGYIQTRDAAFQLEVALPGIDRQKLPPVLSAGVVPVSGESVELHRMDPRRLDLAIADDLLMARIGSLEHPWLVAFCSATPIEPSLLSRLELYVRVLHDLLGRAAADSPDRVAGRLLKLLCDGGADPRTAADRAIGEVRMLTGATQAAIRLTAPEGQVLLRAGDTQLLESEAASSDITNAVAPGVTMNLRVKLPNGHSLTPLDRTALVASADAFTAWGRHEVTGLRNERRSTTRSFADAVDRIVRDVLAKGGSVAVVLMAVARPYQTADLATRAAGLRGLVRPPDMVGAISNSEIALLLHDVSHDQAVIVTERLRRTLDAAPSASGRLVTGVGVAVRQAGSVPNGSVLQEARANALARTDA